MTNSFIDALEEQFNYKFTENGAVALKSTGSKVYDLFALGGAYRSRSVEDCILLFKEAFEEDKVLALKALFYLRDCRGGQGERRFFRICYSWLAKNVPAAAIKNLQHVPSYGRWDDLFVLLDTPIAEDVGHLVKRQLALDMQDAMGNKAISLLGKWMPSENAHSKATKEKAIWLRRYLSMTSKQYRQMLSKLRAHLNVLERLMSANRWDEIEFDKIPSKAGLVYRNAFARRDIIAKKYEAFAKDKNTKVNADTLYPYEVVNKVTSHFSYWNYNFDNMSEVERAMINKYWENLPDYLEGSNASMMCVIDTSGSMTVAYNKTNTAPIDVAISLGLYCAERMTGPFANKYISFASRPQLIHTSGVDFCDKVKRIYETNLVDDTNLEAVFNLLLTTALKTNAKQEEIPQTIVIISDMEINYMSGWDDKAAQTSMEYLRKKWARFGYELPKLVYWNVNARNNTILDRGPNVSFVSGCSPVIFKQVLTGKTGIELMMEVLMSDRYKWILA